MAGTSIVASHFKVMFILRLSLGMCSSGCTLSFY